MTDPDRRQAIVDAFWGGVRSVLIIDDEFPTYESLATSSATPLAVSGELALKLWKGFRNEMHLPCDIASSPPSSKYLDGCDFIILDYELGDHGLAARQMVAELTASTRQNIVLIYTNTPDLQKVKLAIATSVRGVAHLADSKDDDIDDYIDWKTTQAAPSYDDLFSYLRDASAWRAQRASPAERGFAERWVHEHLPMEGNRKLSPFRLEASGVKGPQWIRCGSVFVALHKKDSDHDAAKLRDITIESMVDWDPSFMRILLGFARNKIVSQGLTGDDRVLKDSEVEAGWHFYCGQAVDDNDRRERIGQLYARLIDDLLDDTFSEISKFSVEHGSKTLAAPTSAEESLMSCMERYNIVTGDGEYRIIHKLNHYLAFERMIPRGIRTGTVFVNENRDEFGVVVTPDCDLVPGRRAKHEDARSLQNFFRVVYRPIFLFEPTHAGIDRDDAEATSKERKKRVQKYNELRNQWTAHYKQANNFWHMFLHVPAQQAVGVSDGADGFGDECLILSLRQQDRTLPTRTFYVANEGKIEGGAFYASRICAGNDGKSALEVSPLAAYKVIGQLRDRYAMRLLHEAGHYLSRMGVDFVRWPPE